jgi:hypothetical protein
VCGPAIDPPSSIGLAKIHALVIGLQAHGRLRHLVRIRLKIKVVYCQGRSSSIARTITCLSRAVTSTLRSGKIQTGVAGAAILLYDL